MDEKQILELTEQTTKELFTDFLDVEGDFSFEYVKEEDRPHMVKVTLEGDDLGVLIGQKGTNLYSIEKIISLIVSRKLEEKVSIDLDISGYKSRKQRNLEDMALKAAHQVIDFGVEVDLEPMSPADRRIVHMVLSEEEKVETESAGEGFDRHIVVRPAKL